MRRKVGNPRLHLDRNSDVTNANRRRAALADEFAAKMKIALEQAYYDGGCKTLNGVARWFNDNGYRTPRGGAWSARQVKLLMQRLDPARPAGRKN